MFMQSPHNSSSASHFANLLGNAGVPDDLLGNIPRTPHNDPLATPRSGAIHAANPDLLSLFGGQLMTGAPMMPPAALSDSMLPGASKTRTARISPKQQPSDVKLEPDLDDPLQDRSGADDGPGLGNPIGQSGNDSTMRQNSSNGNGEGVSNDATSAGLPFPGSDGNAGGQGASEEQLKFMQMQYGLAAQMYGPLGMAGFGLPAAAPAFGMPYLDQANLFAVAQQNVAAAAASGHGFDDNGAASAAAAMFGFGGLGAAGIPGLGQNQALAGLAAPLGSTPPIPTKKKRGRKKRKKEESVDTDSTVSTNQSSSARGRQRSAIKSEGSSDNDDEDDDEDYTLEEDAALPPSLKKRKTSSSSSSRRNRKSTPSQSRSSSAAAGSVDSNGNGLSSVTNGHLKNTQRSTKKVSSGDEVTRTSYDNNAMNTAFEYIRSSGIVASNLCAADSDEVLTITNSSSKLSVRIPFGASEVKSQFSEESGLKYRVDGSLVDIAEVLELFQPRDRGHYTMGLTKSQKLERRKDQNRQAAYRARRRAQFLNGMAVQLNSENVALKNYISIGLESEDLMRRKIEALESKLRELGADPDSVVVPPPKSPGSTTSSAVSAAVPAPIGLVPNMILPSAIPFTMPSFSTNGLTDEDTKNSE